MENFEHDYFDRINLHVTEIIENIMRQYPNEQSIIENINLRNKYILFVLAVQNNYNDLLRILLREINL